MILNKLRTLPQYCLPQKILSGLMGKLANQPKLQKQAIKWFVNYYGVDLSEAKLNSIEDYATFNAFFTRELKHGVREFDLSTHVMASPVDGKISQIGQIDQGTLIQAKSHEFSVSDLVGIPALDLQAFNSGQYATLYLSPKDYHRIHMPTDGTLKKMKYIPGKLFAVKPLTAETVSNLFARNERLVMHFETALGPMVMVMVGAMIVGAMGTVWHGLLPRINQIKDWSFSDDDTKVYQMKKGDEVGHFQLGSTVIVLLPDTYHEYQPQFDINQSIKLGQSLFKVQD